MANPFPPRLDIQQTTEKNRGRIEARSAAAFHVTGEQVGFPHARRAAMLMQATDQQKTDPESADDLSVYLLTSRADLGAEEMLTYKRAYWGIENGAHQRLDCSRLQEDKSRVRTRNNAHNLGLFRRCALSLARQWIDHQPNVRKATTNGFIAAMRKDGSELAFRMVTSKNPKWLPSSTRGVT